MTDHCHHLAIDNNNYSTVWLDAMHDRTNYIATAATVDEDLLMTESRCWPPTINATNEVFLELFKNKYILEPKSDVISAIPGEMKIKDVYSGLFFGFALNEFIDQADTSTLNYLKYYESNKNKTISTRGLHIDDPTNFPNSFLYNCDIKIFEYFIGLKKEGTPKYSYEATQVDPPDPVDQTRQPPDIPDWSTANCERRHLYNLNCFWKELLTTIDNDHDHVFGTEYNFNPDDKTAAIECLRRIKFTGFEMIRKTTTPTTYVDFLYKYPKWKIDGAGDEYYYVTTQSLCASNIPTVSNNVKPRPEGKTTKEQKSCFKGLKQLANNCFNENYNAKSHFFMLLKYAGDTSHMVLYDILDKISPNNPDLALHLSERPLLVRTFAKNMNVYCKYLAKFNNERIIKTPNEVFKLTSISDKQLHYMRAKNYIEDLGKLTTLLAFSSVDISTLTVYGDDIDQLDQRLKQLQADPKDTQTPELSDVNKTIIETNHNFIKQILSLSELIGKTDDFVKDIQHVNEKIINRKFFPGSYRCPTLTNLKSFVSSMVNNAINQKNKQKFYRAIDYLHTFKSIIEPLKQEGDLYPVFLEKKNELIGEISQISQNGRKFKRLTEISIKIPDNESVNETKQIRDLQNEPHRLLNWIEDAFTSGSPRSNKSTAIGIQNIVDYLIMYDILTFKVLDEPSPTPSSGGTAGGQLKTGGSGTQAAEDDGSDEEEKKEEEEEDWWQYLDLDDELEKQEVEIFGELLTNIDSIIDSIVDIENSEFTNDDDILKTINYNILDIIYYINTIVDSNVVLPDDVLADLFEALYYVLIQFTYFNEPKPENIVNSEKYVTQFRLEPNTIANILNTANKVITSAAQSRPMVEVMAAVAPVGTGALVLPQPPRKLSEMPTDELSTATTDFSTATTDFSAAVKNVVDEKAAADEEAAKKEADEEAAAEAAETAKKVVAATTVQFKIRQKQATAKVKKMKEAEEAKKKEEEAKKKEEEAKAKEEEAKAKKKEEEEAKKKEEEAKAKEEEEADKKAAAEKEAAGDKKRDREPLYSHYLISKIDTLTTPFNKKNKPSTKGAAEENKGAAEENEGAAEENEGAATNKRGRGANEGDAEANDYKRQSKKRYLNKYTKGDENTPPSDNNKPYSDNNKRGIGDVWNPVYRPAKRRLKFTGGAKTRKKTKSSKLRKTIKKRILKKIKRKSIRRKKPIKKRVNSKNRKVKRKIKNKTKKYKKPKKQKRSRKPKPKPKP